MPRLALNKTSLNRESRQLNTYERFLPSLDLKRRQLIAERNRACKELADTDTKISGLQASVGAALPMAADTRLNLRGLVTVESVDIGEENVVGLRLPLLKDVQMQRASYSFLARPHWVDVLADILETLLLLRVQRQVQAERVAVLDVAVNKVTQRVNLFDKVLIPRSRDNIRRIRIMLSDAEKAAVVNAKIAKRKRQQR